MILGFKEQFKQKIIDGTKKHTIREDMYDRWEAGRIIHFATGVRTKHYDCFKIDVCKSTQKIETGIRNVEKGVFECAIKIDGRVLSEREAEQFVIRDGFRSIPDFFDFFNFTYFKGKIIHWTDLKY